MKSAALTGRAALFALQLSLCNRRQSFFEDRLHKESPGGVSTGAGLQTGGLGRCQSGSLRTKLVLATPDIRGTTRRSSCFSPLAGAGSVLSCDQAKKVSVRQTCVRVANASPDRPQPRLAGQDVHTLRRRKVLRRQPSTDYGWVHSAVYAHDPLIFWTTTYFFWTALCVFGFLG